MSVEFYARVQASLCVATDEGVTKFLDGSGSQLGAKRSVFFHKCSSRPRALDCAKLPEQAAFLTAAADALAPRRCTRAAVAAICRRRLHVAVIRVWVGRISLPGIYARK